MPLSLNTREIGRVTIVRCSGRIASGETEVLHLHIVDLLRDRSDIVLHLGEVVFVDSNGLGMLVRLITSTRSARGDLKLCQVPEAVHKVLKITNLTTLFDIHASEENAVLAFYRRHAAPAHPRTPVSRFCALTSPPMSWPTCANCWATPATTFLPATVFVTAHPVARHPARSRHTGTQPERSARGGANLPQRMRRPRNRIGKEFSTLEAGQAAPNFWKKSGRSTAPGPSQPLT